MAKHKLEAYQLPLLLIKEVVPTLEKDGHVYAHKIIGETEKKQTIEFIERRELPMEKYIGRTAECLLEILDADFWIARTKEEIKDLPKDIEKATYLWSNTGYKFIYELLYMIEGHPEDPDYDYDEDEYEELANKLFGDWGNHGLGLNVYQYKPMIKTDDGVFLLNEYRNEETIEEWELGDTIYFKPKQILLRGLKLTNNPDWRKHVKEEEPLKHYEKRIVGKPRIIDPW